MSLRVDPSYLLPSDLKIVFLEEVHFENGRSPVVDSIIWILVCLGLSHVFPSRSSCSASLDPLEYNLVLSLLMQKSNDFYQNMLRLIMGVNVYNKYVSNCLQENLEEDKSKDDEEQHSHRTNYWTQNFGPSFTAASFDICR